MKTVFSNGAEVAHRWANRAQPSARAGNVSFGGDSFFSYSTVIARLLRAPSGETWAVISSGRWSNSTSKHQRLALRAASHLRVFRPEWTDYGRNAEFFTPADFVTLEARAIADALPAALRAHRLYALERLEERQACAEAFASAFGVVCPAFPLSYSDRNAAREKIGQRSANLERRRSLALVTRRLNRTVAALAQRGLSVPWELRLPAGEVPFSALSAADDAIRAHDQAEASRDLAEVLEGWRNGARHDLRLHRAPVALRLRTDERGRLTVETSHGATVLLAQALRLFSFARLCVTRGTGYDAQRANAVEVGPYHLRSIDAHGNAQVGCHYLPFEEMTRLYATLQPAQIASAASERAEVVA